MKHLRPGTEFTDRAPGCFSGYYSDVYTFIRLSTMFPKSGVFTSRGWGLVIPFRELMPVEGVGSSNGVLLNGDHYNLDDF